MSHFKQLIWLSIFVLLVSPCMLQAKVTATIDRTDIGAGETFVLNIRVEEDTAEQPDLSLIPQEFTIVSQSQYHHSQFINGKRATVQGWQIKLKTLKSGELTIPSITVGKFATQPIKLNIRDSSDQLNLNGESKVIFLEAEVDTNEAYVQQQVIFTVKLYRAVNTHYASLSEPQADNAIVEKLGDDTQFEKYINNRRYHVTQRRYALFPQQSGETEISAVNFTADVTDNSRRNRSSFLSATRPISITTKPINLSVKPKPTNVSEPWLPATDVVLTDKWSPNTQELKVGEPVTWTILLNVQGLSESQLPEIEIPRVAGLQWYYDSPQKERQINDDGVVGQRIEKLAVIPSKEGIVTIPEVKLSWWDTKSDSEKTAVLSARTFKVLPAASTTQTAGISPLPQIESLTSSNDPALQSQLQKWQLAAAALLALWLVTLFAYWRKPVSSKPAQKNQLASPPPQKANDVFKLLLTAAKQGNNAKIEQLLIEWVNLNGFTQYHSIGSLAKVIDDSSLKAKLEHLESMRYSATNSATNISLVKSDFEHILSALSVQQNNAASQAIPPLYPR
ncbi:protein BatD [Aliikangiella marina]|uniref:Protein BatD n=1 Tax=Aliikangiella marina TaxID=1712262 RepID=A0A545T2W7_9GAMM|nr:BatD family protein [Aliikangiella marina]TQV71549.1 protein BatD [Aliikangiella marina]